MPIAVAEELQVNGCIETGSGHSPNTYRSLTYRGQWFPLSLSWDNLQVEQVDGRVESQYFENKIVVRKKKLTLTALATVVVVFICYVLFEFGGRVIDGRQPNGFAGTRTGYERLMRLSGRQNLTPEGFVRKEANNQFLGWGSLRCEKNYRSESTAPLIIIYGDSVSVGKGAPKSRAYSDLMANQLGDAVTLVNHAEDGYGVDQMIMKAIFEMECHSPDLVLINYIPHDLLRMGTGFIYNWPKPKFLFRGENAQLNLAEKAGKFYGDYKYAKDNYYFSLWLTRFIWDNKEYFSPNLFMGYYKKVINTLNTLLLSAAIDSGAEVAFVKLSNSTEFRGRSELQDVAETFFSNHTNLDDCTVEVANRRGLTWEDTFMFHPGEAGHEIYSDCLIQVIESIIPLRATQP